MGEIRTFDLPLPPSVNAMYRNVLGRGRVKTKAYKDWLAAAWYTVLADAPSLHRIRGPYTIIAEFKRPNLRSDLDNRIKPVSDLLVKLGVIEDDRFAEEITLRWADIEGCRVTLRPAAWE